MLLPHLTPSKVSLSITKPRTHDSSKRIPAYASLGPLIDGALPPHPDIGDQLGAVASVRKRYGIKMPRPDHFKIRRFRRFVQRWLRRKMKPFAATHAFDVVKWLAETNYTEERKKELLSLWEKNVALITNKTVRAKAFLKDESYPEYKYPRSINSRSDVFKCFFGPMIKDIETELYKDPAFIKHIPMMDRPSYIKHRLYRPGARYMQTDFTAYESSFTQLIMDVTDFELLRYMLSGMGDYLRMVSWILEAKASLNEIEYKTFLVRLLAVRLSGEMDTSCSNGFANLMINKFIVSELGGSIKMVVEGDDGLASVIGCSPSPADYASLGFNIKLVMFDNFYEASFCGIVFDPDCDVNIAEPLKPLAKFGWTTHKYVKANTATKMKLLKAKSESLCWQYPGCPILQELGLYGLRMTKHVNLGNWLPNEGWWEREQRLRDVQRDENGKAKPLPTKPVQMSTRLLMEKIFKVDVQTQLLIEGMLSSKCDLLPLQVKLDLFPTCWVDYFVRYASPKQSDIYHPTMHWPEKYTLNMGWETVKVTKVTKRGTFTKLRDLGYVDYCGLRHYDAIWDRRPKFAYYNKIRNAH